MNARVRWRLAGMMALVYAVQGAWWPLLSVHLQDLGISGRGRGWIFATLAVASLATPLGAGQLADRLMATQWLLALIYGCGTCLLAFLATGTTTQTLPLVAIFLAYWLLTAPGYGLTNSLAMRNLRAPREQFGAVRLWGTVGWMAIGWVVSVVMAFSGSARIGQGTYEAFWVGVIVSGAFAIYCLTLPHTPPLATSTGGGFEFRASMQLVARREIAVYLAVAFGVSLTTPFVFQVIPGYLEARGLPRPWTATAMTLGQIPEVATLALLPWLLRRLGYRGTLGLGIAAWGVRYGSLVFDPPLWVCLAGNVLHGLGIACFTVGGQVYLDSQAPADRRASAQALNVVVTSGIGSLLGNLLAGEAVARWSNGAGLVFLVPCLINAGLLVYFVQGFRPQTTREGRGAGPINVRPPVREGAPAAATQVCNLGAESGDG